MALGGALLMLGLGVGYWYGHVRAAQTPSATAAELATLRTELKAQDAEARVLVRQLESSRVGADIDRATLGSVREEVIALKSELSRLTEQNAFYRNLMAPAEGDRGIGFGRVSVRPAAAPQQYAYTVVVQQIAGKHQKVSGSMRLEVTGATDGEAVTLGLALLAGTTDVLPLDFTYFQTFEGVLTLPDGFVPERLVLAARSVKPRSKRIEQSYLWVDALGADQGAGIAERDTL